jgi:deoxyribonuclease-4
MSLFGAHIQSDIDDLINNTVIMKNNKCNIVQLFTNKFSKKAYEKYKEFGNFINVNNIKCVIHSSYTINISRNWDHHSWWLKQFILELEIANMIGAIGVVIHIGKQKDLPIEVAINNMYTSIEHVLSKTKHLNTMILIETSSGQGSEMLYNLDDFSIFYNRLMRLDIYKHKLGICVDTCHIYAAGYNIKGEKNIIEFIKYFDKIIGLSHIKLIHLNDSKKSIGSKIDRHDGFETGQIGLKSIKLIYKFFNELCIPIILETPSVSIINDIHLLLLV